MCNYSSVSVELVSALPQSLHLVSLLAGPKVRKCKFGNCATWFILICFAKYIEVTAVFIMFIGNTFTVTSLFIQHRSHSEVAEECVWAYTVTLTSESCYA